MRVLLDECLPRDLKREIVGHDVATVAEMGWAGVKNGALIRRASWVFDAFVTVDRGIARRPDLVAEAGSLAVVVLSTPSNRIEDLTPLVPALQRALDAPRAGEVIAIG